MANNAPDFESILGVPVTVTSGYRDPKKNALVGGVPNSDHLTDSARDFVPKGMSMSDAAARLKAKGGFRKVINEGDHVHVSYDQGQKVPISDDDLLKALTGGKPSTAAIAEHAPEQLSDDQIMKALTSGGADKPAAAAAPPAAKAQVSTFADVVRSIPGGITKGVNALIGLPGDVQELIGRGVYGGLNALSGKDTPFPGDKGSTDTSSPTSLPTSGTLNEAISKPFGGFYKPQTRAGKYAETISTFAPAAIAPGSLTMRAARTIVPGAASEAAGQATEGKSYEGLARFGGALAGGGALGAAKALAAPKENLPSVSDLKSASQAAYKAAEDAGVVIKKSAVQKLGKDIQAAVADAGIDQTLHPKAMAAVKRVLDTKGNLTLKGMDILRRVANGAAGSMDKDESRIAHIVLDHIDDFVQNLGPGHVLSGDPEAASAALTDARALWAKSAKGKVIEGLFDRAKNRAETIGGSGYENALRVEFRQLAQNEKRLRRFSKGEQEAIRDVARGGTIQNAARLVGKLAPTNALSILGSLGAMSLEPVSGLVVPAAGIAGRGIATAATLSKAEKAAQMVRRGGPAPAKPAITPELLSALLARKKQDDIGMQGNALVPAMAGR